MSLWWRGPKLRVAPFGIVAIGQPSDFFAAAGVAAAPVFFTRVGQDTNMAYMTVGALANRSRQLGPHAAGKAFSQFQLAGRLQQDPSQWYLDKWHHMVVAANRRDLDRGSMKGWMDGQSASFWCPPFGNGHFAPGFLADPETEPWLPPNRSLGCNWSHAVGCNGLPVCQSGARFPMNASDVVLSVGSSKWFNQPGTIGHDSGGQLASLSLTSSSTPFTVANRMALADAEPAFAVAAMPTIGGGTVECEAGTPLSMLAGRVVCFASCPSAAQVPALRLDVLCSDADPLSPWLREPRAVLCGSRSTSGDGSGGVWDSGATGLVWSGQASSWSSPLGWSGVLGAASRAAQPGWDASGMAAWGRGAPWHPGDRRVSEKRPQHAAESALQCVAPPPLLQWWAASGRSMVVQVCLGGLAADARYRLADDLLQSVDELSAMLLQARQEAALLMGLRPNATARLWLERAGATSSEQALALRRAALGPGSAPGTAEALCEHPARSAVQGLLGKGAVQDCVCLHLGIRPGLPAGGGAVRESAGYLGASFASSPRDAPTESTPLSLFASASRASVALLPVQACGGADSREQGEAQAGVDDSTGLLMRAITEGLGAATAWGGRAALAGSFPSLAQCGTSLPGQLLPLVVPLVAGAVILGVAGCVYCRQRGSLADGPLEAAALSTMLADGHRLLLASGNAPSVGSVSRASVLERRAWESAQASARPSRGSGPRPSAELFASGSLRQDVGLPGRVATGDAQLVSGLPRPGGSSGAQRAQSAGDGVVGSFVKAGVRRLGGDEGRSESTDDGDEWEAGLGLDVAVRGLAGEAEEARCGAEEDAEAAARGRRDASPVVAPRFSTARAAPEASRRQCRRCCPHASFRDAVSGVGSAVLVAMQLGVVGAVGLAPGRPVVDALLLLSVAPLVCRVLAVVCFRHASVSSRLQCGHPSGQGALSEWNLAGALVGAVGGGAALDVAESPSEHGERLGIAKRASQLRALWPSTMMSVLMALAVDLRAVRLMLSGLYAPLGHWLVLPGRHRAARRGLAQLELAASGVWLVAWAACSGLLLWTLNDAACDALSTPSALELASSGCAAAGVRCMCSLHGEGLLWVGVPALCGVAVAAAGLLGRVWDSVCPGGSE
ncbi:hypothetical protein FNF27_00469 [Cafeteria roenbergensis]|uniref:Uncharacterized protein n=2 Tax=Cafeteria roenbergensis TaxID=33653 RepID=A0A5A8EQ96_CAFRO|nr:hypothetical protein FNF27_00469 [Cafeteria roenbergensis]